MTNIDPHIDPSTLPSTVDELEALRDQIQEQLIVKRQEINQHEIEQTAHRTSIAAFRKNGNEDKATESTNLLRTTLTEERELSAEKIALVKTLKTINGILGAKIEEREDGQISELRQRHVDEALEAIRDSLEAPLFEHDDLHHAKKTSIVEYLEERGEDKPLYLKNNDLKEDHTMGIDNVIVDDFVTLLQEKPVLLLEELAGAAESSDVEEANILLRKAHEHWNKLEAEYTN